VVKKREFLPSPVSLLYNLGKYSNFLLTKPGKAKIEVVLNTVLFAVQPHTCIQQSEAAPCAAEMKRKWWRSEKFPRAVAQVLLAQCQTVFKIFYVYIDQSPARLCIRDFLWASE